MIRYNLQGVPCHSGFNAWARLVIIYGGLNGVIIEAKMKKNLPPLPKKL
jgi:hypothetical protein